MITMLIVEDQPLMRSTLRRFLQPAYPDASIVEASDGASAMELCRRHQPQLVLLDVGLPDVNGIDLIGPMRTLLPGGSVVVVSQHVGREYIERARAAGAAAYVAKERIYSDLLPAAERALSGTTDGEAK